MATRHPFELTIPVNAIDHAVGPAHAPITVVEYGDFECPNCKQAVPALKLLLQQFPERIRIVFRHFPLEQVHPHALLAAQAAESAGAQGRFWEMHDVLFARQQHLTRKHLEAYAAELDLDRARFAADLDDEVYLQRVREHIAGGTASGARGTPTFFVNNRVQDVSFGLHALADRIQALLGT
jgi:protein-disulfide isomerase